MGYSFKFLVKTYQEYIIKSKGRLTGMCSEILIVRGMMIESYFYYFTYFNLLIHTTEAASGVVL